MALLYRRLGLLVTSYCLSLFLFPDGTFSQESDVPPLNGTTQAPVESTPRGSLGKWLLIIVAILIILSLSGAMASCMLAPKGRSKAGKSKSKKSKSGLKGDLKVNSATKNAAKSSTASTSSTQAGKSSTGKSSA